MIKRQLAFRALVALSLSVLFPSLAISNVHHTTHHGHKTHQTRSKHPRKTRVRTHLTNTKHTKRHHANRRHHYRHRYQPMTVTVNNAANPALTSSANASISPLLWSPTSTTTTQSNVNTGATSATSASVNPTFGNHFYNQLATQLNPHVLKLALNAYAHARAQGLDQKGILTIIDFSKDSTQQRMWGLDLNHNRILFSSLVAHGKNSGDRFARYFSNQPGSRASSLGLFLTTNTYYGHKGISLRLKGLERGINDNAEKRAIVVHGAAYVTNSFAQRLGRLGLSWGCPAVPMEKARSIISTIKNGTLLFAYYPNNQWLHHSNYLG